MIQLDYNPVSSFVIKIRCIFKEERNLDQPVSECLQRRNTPASLLSKFQDSDSQHKRNSLTSQIHWRLNDCNCCLVYVRATSADESSTSPNVISKTEVAPVKQLSIPKLDFEADTLLAEVTGFCVSKMTTIIC